MLGKSVAFDLGEDFSQSRFVDFGNGPRVLGRLAASCPRLSRLVGALAEDASVKVDLDALFQNAIRQNDPPVLLVLGWYVAYRRGTGADAFLPPVVRCLLRGIHSTGCWGFAFKWLLIEASRLLAANSLVAGVERWDRLADAHREHSCGRADLDRHLEILIRACSALELLAVGDLTRAEQEMAELEAAAGGRPPAILGAYLEAQGEMYQGLGKFRQALSAHERALHVLRQDVEMPGLTGFVIHDRQAETEARLGLNHLLLNQHGMAIKMFEQALKSISSGTDPGLRFAVLCHMRVAARSGGAQEPWLAAAASTLLKDTTIPAYLLIRRPMTKVGGGVCCGLSGFSDIRNFSRAS